MLWTCAACTTRYAASLAACPHCRSTEREEDGMPKTSVIGGPSYVGHVDVSSPDTVGPEWAEASVVVEPSVPVEVVAPVEPAPVEAEPVAEAKPAPRRKGKA